MSYYDHFKLANDYITHTNTVVHSIHDPFIQRRYIGFVTISAVTVYELSVKDILVDFSSKKHPVFGVVVDKLYDRLNGRISLQDLREQHVRRFGERYYNRFKKRLDKREAEILRTRGRSVKSSYGNIITWRNKFVHEGHVPSSATYDEVVQAYEDGKEVLHTLFKCMYR